MTKVERPHILSVLVVESDADTANSTAELLELYGFGVTVARDGGDALRAAAVSPPDVVILEPHRLDVDGWELVGRLRRQEGQKRPCCVAVTTQSRDEDRQRSAEAGVDLHLVKPVPPRELLHLLDGISHLTEAG